MAQLLLSGCRDDLARAPIEWRASRLGVGNMGLPPKVLKKGIKDMVRISDARMSGTGYGTVILHTTLEEAAGGPLAIVRDGDYIELDVPNRKLYRDISQAEIKRRLAASANSVEPSAGGYTKLYHDHVAGADFDFLKGCRGNAVPKDSH